MRKIKNCNQKKSCLETSLRKGVCNLLARLRNMDYSETLTFPFLTVWSGTHFRVNGIGFILSDATFIGNFFDDLLHFSLRQHLHFFEVDLILLEKSMLQMRLCILFYLFDYFAAQFCKKLCAGLLHFIPSQSHRTFVPENHN